MAGDGFHRYHLLPSLAFIIPQSEFVALRVCHNILTVGVDEAKDCACLTLCSYCSIVKLHYL